MIALITAIISRISMSIQGIFNTRLGKKISTIKKITDQKM